MEWMILPLKRYADFSGRSRRTEFWMIQLLNILIYGVVIVLVLSALPWAELEQSSGTMPSDPGVLFWIGFVILVFWALITIVPSLAVTIRRLHDRNMSGWWYLGFIVLNFIPLVNLIASIAFLVLMCLPGTPGDNSFGADPKDPNNLDVFA